MISEYTLGAASIGLIAVTALPTEILPDWGKLSLGVGLLYVVFHLTTRTVPQLLQEKDKTHAEAVKYCTDQTTKSIDKMSTAVDNLTESIRIHK